MIKNNKIEKLIKKASIPNPMIQSLSYWCGLYEKLKSQALCLDIETTRFNGPISVIGLYPPKDGEIECQQFVRGRDLTEENLAQAFANCKLLVTFNGRRFDVPKIRQEFPGAIPDSIPIIDLYLFAIKLNMKAGLKVLENLFGIERLDPRTKRKGIATRLWQRYEQFGHPTVLQLLLEYNKQDIVNLYPLAEELMKLAKKGEDTTLKPHNLQEWMVEKMRKQHSA